jgi:hypothetical protein
MGRWLPLLLLGCGAQDEWTALGRSSKGTPLRQIFGFEGKLYLGHGDPNANSGPTDVLVYDKELKREFTCDDEVIARFRVLDGTLVIPGADATEDWEWGNVYVREKQGWVKHRTIPHAVHVLDIAEFKGAWYAGTAVKSDADASLGVIYESKDRGKTWKKAFALPASKSRHTRMGTLAVHDGKLYAFPYSYAGDRYVPDPMGEADTIVFDGSDWKTENLFREPDLSMIRTAVSFRNQLLIHAVFGKNVLFGNRGEPRNALGTFEKVFREGAIKDVEVCGERLVVLDDKIRWTTDLAHWESVDGPAAPAESVWMDGDRIYVGCREGTLNLRRR